MKINSNRLKDNLIKIGEIGRSGKGITRIAYSNDYFAARNKLKELMLEQGLKVTVDGVGNLFGRREGLKNLPAIMLGSHLDTVMNGGLFDGNLGVIAALECISVLNDYNINTNHPIEIVAFIAEEAGELGGTFGSRVFMGKQDTTEEGLKEKLLKYNMTIKDIKDSVRDPNTVKAFLELHIEQGGFLDNKKIPIGIVNGIAGIRRYKIRVFGETNHAGTTPMSLRKDALVMASSLILKINDISKKMGAPFVSTIGTISAFPGSPNVIPGEVEFILEMRDLESKNIDIAYKKIMDFIAAIDDFSFDFKLLIDKPPVKTSKDIVRIIEEVCKDNDINFEIMASGAGHDAKEIATEVPTGMIFVPSRKGISHSPEEFTSWEDITLGTQVLLESLMELDKP